MIKDILLHIFRYEIICTLDNFAWISASPVVLAFTSIVISIAATSTIISPVVIIIVASSPPLIIVAIRPWFRLDPIRSLPTSISLMPPTVLVSPFISPSSAGLIISGGGTFSASVRVHTAATEGSGWWGRPNGLVISSMLENCCLYQVGRQTHHIAIFTVCLVELHSFEQYVPPSVDHFQSFIFAPRVLYVMRLKIFDGRRGGWRFRGAWDWTNTTNAWWCKWLWLSFNCEQTSVLRRFRCGLATITPCTIRNDAASSSLYEPWLHASWPGIFIIWVLGDNPIRDPLVILIVFLRKFEELCLSERYFLRVVVVELVHRGLTMLGSHKMLEHAVCLALGPAQVTLVMRLHLRVWTGNILLDEVKTHHRMWTVRYLHLKTDWHLHSSRGRVLNRPDRRDLRYVLLLGCCEGSLHMLGARHVSLHCVLTVQFQLAEVTVVSRFLLLLLKTRISIVWPKRKPGWEPRLCHRHHVLRVGEVSINVRLVTNLDLAFAIGRPNHWLLIL